ncbi:MAG: copper chaperone PCu(A)C [Magnetococcales bacterium]|nr:copper chaperone PCu(A)C [Magnetococcales bacterium]
MKPLPLSSLLLTFLFALPVGAQDALQILDPWIREAPPVMQTLAAYMTINNPSQQEQTIVAVSSSVFSKVGIHETVQQEGMSMMEARERLVIAPNSRLQLAPGGYHLMLVTPQKPLKAKDRVPMTVTLGDGSKVTFEAEVRSGAMGTKEDVGHKNMHH